MTVFAIVVFVAFVWWFIVNWRRTERRFDRDLPRLRDDHEHQWRTVPGSAVDVCECGDTQLRRWTT